VKVKKQVSHFSSKSHDWLGRRLGSMVNVGGRSLG